MDEGAREVQQEEQVIPEAAAAERDPIRETERLLGYKEQTFSLEDQDQDSSYLASVAAFGNAMMLEVLEGRIQGSRKAVGKDSDEYTVIQDLMEVIVNGYDEKVNKENFPTKYGNMVEKYGQLGGACKMYLTSLGKQKRWTETGSRRVKTVTQVARVVEREMHIIRSRSGQMAESAEGMTWREMFMNEGRMERTLRMSRSEKSAEQQPSGGKKEGGASTPAKSSPQDEQIRRLQAQVQRLQDRLDAPKLKVMQEDEKAVWRGTVQEGVVPTIMTAERFRALLAEPAMEGSDLEASLVAEIERILGKLHWKDKDGKAAPVFSKRLLQQLLEKCKEQRESSDVLHLLSGQLEAAQRYQPPEAEEEAKEKETADPAEESGDLVNSDRSPFENPDGTLNNDSKALNARLTPQLRGTSPNWTKIRLVYDLMREHRLYAMGEDKEVLDNLERDIIDTIGAGRTYGALEELRDACIKIRGKRAGQSPQQAETEQDVKDQSAEKKDN